MINFTSRVYNYRFDKILSINDELFSGEGFALMYCFGITKRSSEIFSFLLRIFFHAILTKREKK